MGELSPGKRECSSWCVSQYTGGVLARRARRRNMRTRALFLALASLALSAASAALWCQPSGADDIVFVSGRSGNRDIWRMDASGGSLQQLTLNPGVDDSPIVSPQCDRIAYLSDAGSYRGAADVWVMDLDGSNKLRLTYATVSALPQWSPDGAWIAFIRRTGSSATQVWVVPSDGSGPESRVDIGRWYIRGVRWSWDGSLLLYTRDDGGGRWAVRATSPVGGGASLVVDHYHHSLNPAYSPDGAELAYSYVQWPAGPASMVFVRDLMTGTERLLYDNSATEPEGWTQAAWSPDGSMLALSIYPPARRAAGYARTIKVIDSTTGDLLGQTTQGDSGFSDDTSYYDGDTLVAGDRVWSLDCSRLVFMSNRDGDWDIYTMDPDGTDPVNLTQSSKGYDGRPSWIWSDPLVEVVIDIHPGSDPNPINLGSRGVIPVAILSSASFDATRIDPSTVLLAGAPVAAAGKSDRYMAEEDDVDRDGLLDLVVHVQTQLLDPEQLSGGFAELTGATYDGLRFEGKDSIVLVPRGRGGARPAGTRRPR